MIMKIKGIVPEDIVVTANQAAKKLVSLYRRECDISKYYVLQTNFDDYVRNWCANSGLVESELTEEQLFEIAFSAVEYDGFLASFNN